MQQDVGRYGQSEVGGVQHNMRYDTVSTERKACSKQGAFHQIQAG